LDCSGKKPCFSWTAHERILIQCLGIVLLRRRNCSRRGICDSWRIPLILDCFGLFSTSFYFDLLPLDCSAEVHVSSSCFSRLLAPLGFWLVQFNLYCTLCAGLW
jgi:hypothetical protein